MTDEKDFFSFEDEEEEYDPLTIDDEIINQEDMDDDNPYDVTDYPTMREMPPDPYAGAHFTPEVKGGAEEAMLSLFDHNPSRRPVFLGILKFCCGGKKSSEVAKKVDELQEDNKSVYTPSTLCRMLVGAGGLDLEKPEIIEEKEDIEEGVEYLEIKERVDPVYTTTKTGEKVLEDETQGRYFWVIMQRDGKYIEVYCDVLAFIQEKPRQIREITSWVDNLPICQRPRRFGAHFIDMLERADAVYWHKKAWTITALGEKLLPQLQEAINASKVVGVIEKTEEGI